MCSAVQCIIIRALFETSIKLSMQTEKAIAFLIALHFTLLAHVVYAHAFS